MGKMIELTATDGHKLAAYRADPPGKPRGGIVVIQEIFGVNSHIKGVADGYAADGYLAIAPAMYDRVKRGYDTGYSQDEIQAGLKIMQGLDWANTMKDVVVAVEEAKKAGKVGVVGYCWGGTQTWTAAAKLDGIACASGYYGGGLATQVELMPRVPTILHFGEKDGHIPLTDVEKVRTAHPEVAVYVYPAGHGFNCDARASYDAASAKLARERTLALFAKHLG